MTQQINPSDETSLRVVFENTFNEKAFAKSLSFKLKQPKKVITDNQFLICSCVRDDVHTCSTGLKAMSEIGRRRS